jgi:hypothetical protein
MGRHKAVTYPIRHHISRVSEVIQCVSIRSLHFQFDSLNHRGKLQPAICSEALILELSVIAFGPA